MKHTLQRFFPFVLMSCLVFGISCTKKDSSTGPDDNNNTQQSWKTGSTATYAVNSAAPVSVQDSISGCTFVLPASADKQLIVTRVLSGTTVDDLASDIFTVEFTGDQHAVTLEVPTSSNTTNAVMSYSMLVKGSVEGLSNAGWWGMAPTGSQNGKEVYSLNLTTAGAAKPGAYTPPKENTFAVSKIPANSTEAQKMAAVRASVEQCINTWVSNVPVSDARARVNALPYVIRWSDSNAYTHSNSILFSNAVFYFKVDAQLVSIAHEVGHYMTHVLLGYDRYNEIYDRFPKDWMGSSVEHDIGWYREGRKEILEDYPYISMLMITGEVDQYDLTSVKKLNNVRDLIAADPKSVDYPSHEGFGAIILASLLRTSNTVYSFNGQTAKVPVVGASMRDVLGILARGPRDVNECRSYIQDYLDAKGNDQRFKLAAMLEPIGWSYNGTGTLVDKDHKTLSGIKVKCVLQDGDTEYYLSETTSDKKGVIKLDRIFPGTSNLRVWFNAGKDSVDVPITAEWTKPTNQALTLGQISVAAQSQTVDLKYSGNYSLTPGVRAQNPLTLSYSGNMRISPEIAQSINTTVNGLDVQASAHVNEEMIISFGLTYTLARGAEWTTSLNPGDYGDAGSAVTTLSNPHLVITTAVGPSYTYLTSTMTASSPMTFNYSIPPATDSYQGYQLSVRLEWDFVQKYYKGDAQLGSTSGKTGATIFHVWRDVN